MSEEQRRTLASLWLDKANSSLEDARLLKENGRLPLCANRLYYAVFYAACAALASRGLSYGRHSAVRSAVHRDFVNAGILKKEQGRAFDILLTKREQSDYEPTAVFFRGRNRGVFRSGGRHRRSFRKDRCGMLS